MFTVVTALKIQCWQSDQLVMFWGLVMKIRSTMLYQCAWIAFVRHCTYIKIDILTIPYCITCVCCRNQLISYLYIGYCSNVQVKAVFYAGYFLLLIHHCYHHWLGECLRFCISLWNTVLCANSTYMCCCNADNDNINITTIKSYLVIKIKTNNSQLLLNYSHFRKFCTGFLTN